MRKLYNCFSILLIILCFAGCGVNYQSYQSDVDDWSYKLDFLNSVLGEKMMELSAQDGDGRHFEIVESLKKSHENMSEHLLALSEISPPSSGKDLHEKVVESSKIMGEYYHRLAEYLENMQQLEIELSSKAEQFFKLLELEGDQMDKSVWLLRDLAELKLHIADNV